MISPRQERMVAASALIAAFAWFFGFLILGYINTAGALIDAGAGALLLSLVPSGVFLVMLAILFVKNLRKSYYVALVFWTMMILTLGVVVVWNFTSHGSRPIEAETLLHGLIVIYSGQGVIAVLTAIIISAHAAVTKLKRY